MVTPRKVNPKDPSKKPKGGFNPQLLKLIEAMARMGATETDLAEALGVHRVTLYRWKVEFPDLRKAIDEGGQMADQRVEKALYNRACGYDHKATKLIVVQGKVEKVDVVEHHPPDTTAMIFWLANRQPQKWQRNPVARDDVKMDVGTQIPQMSKSEFARRLSYFLREQAKERERIAVSSASPAGAGATSNKEKLSDQ